MVEPFIPKVNSEQNQDLKVWSFSGVVEEGFNHNLNLFEGWTFFEVCKPVSGTINFDFKYTGIARVFFDPKHGKAWTVRKGKSSEEYQLFKVSTKKLRRQSHTSCLQVPIYEKLTNLQKQKVDHEIA